MKVYVDELPKSCSVCACGVEDEMCCCWCMAFEDDFHHYIHSEDFETKRLPSCPLHSLTDYTKQVRKEVREEIKSKIVYYAVSVLDEAGKVKENAWGISKKDIDKILDQIQGETEWK